MSVIQTAAYASSAPPRAEPVSATERVVAADVLRGVAIFGILLVNMRFFNQPVALEALSADLWTRPVDDWTKGVIRFFAEGKFYALFSFLFGWGFSVLTVRVVARGVPAGRLYRRRLAILAGFALLHILLLWPGDVLLIYALLGLTLPWFKRVSDRALRRWIIILIVAPILVTGMFFALESAGRATPEGAAAMAAQMAEQEAWFQGMADQALRVYSAGTFAEMVAQRVFDYMIFFVGWVILAGAGFHVLAMFLLGLYAARRRWLHDAESRAQLWRHLLLWALPVGIVANLVFVWGAAGVEGMAATPRGVAGRVGALIGAPAFFATYVAALLLWMRREAVRDRMVALFAPVGRMALTNYLLQSVIATTIFYGYGLGLYGRMGGPEGLALTVGIFLAQVGLSHLWLQRYRFGPAEWLWRTLTYGSRQPIRGSPGPTVP